LDLGDRYSQQFVAEGQLTKSTNSGMVIETPQHFSMMPQSPSNHETLKSDYQPPLSKDILAASATAATYPVLIVPQNKGFLASHSEEMIATQGPDGQQNWNTMTNASPMNMEFPNSSHKLPQQSEQQPVFPEIPENLQNAKLMNHVVEQNPHLPQESLQKQQSENGIKYRESPNDIVLVAMPASMAASLSHHLSQNIPPPDSTEMRELAFGQALNAVSVSRPRSRTTTQNLEPEPRKLGPTLEPQFVSRQRSRTTTQNLEPEPRIVASTLETSRPRSRTTIQVPEMKQLSPSGDMSVTVQKPQDPSTIQSSIQAEIAPKIETNATPLISEEVTAVLETIVVPRPVVSRVQSVRIPNPENVEQKSSNAESEEKLSLHRPSSTNHSRLSSTGTFEETHGLKGDFSGSVKRPHTTPQMIFETPPVKQPTTDPNQVAIDSVWDDLDRLVSSTAAKDVRKLQPSSKNIKSDSIRF
jgi:hypothetical protein